MRKHVGTPLSQAGGEIVRAAPPVDDRSEVNQGGTWTATLRCIGRPRTEDRDASLVNCSSNMGPIQTWAGASRGCIYGRLQTPLMWRSAGETTVMAALVRVAPTNEPRISSGPLLRRIETFRQPRCAVFRSCIGLAIVPAPNFNSVQESIVNHASRRIASRVISSFSYGRYWNRKEISGEGRSRSRA